MNSSRSRAADYTQRLLLGAARSLQQELKLSLDQHVPELGTTLGDELLKPTRIYVRAIQALLAALPDTVHSICHVTGGGIVGN